MFTTAKYYKEGRLYKKMKEEFADKKLKEQFIEAVRAERQEEFLKEHGCEATKEELRAFLEESKHYRYTTDRAYALEKKKAGLKVSVAFYAAVSKGTPVYELVKSGSYRYTTSRTEAKSLKKKGYTYKGIVWQAEKA